MRLSCTSKGRATQPPKPKSRVSGYAYLPRLTWFPGTTPVPPPVPDPVDVTPLTGTIYADNGGPIRGVLKAGDTEYLIVPKGGGQYGPVRKGM